MNRKWGRTPPRLPAHVEALHKCSCIGRVVLRHTCEAPHRVPGTAIAGETAGLVQLAGYLPLAMAHTHTAERKEDLIPASGW